MEIIRSTQGVELSSTRAQTSELSQGQNRASSSSQSLSNNQNNANSKDDLSSVNLNTITENLNEQMQTLGTNIRFAYNDDYRGLTVRVIDQNTGDVIRQIPSEEAIKMAEYFRTALGLIFDKES